VSDFSYAYGEPAASATFKKSPEDFVVTEMLGFEPEINDRGQHHWLWLQKKEHNTDYIARALAKFVGVEPNKVSYSGLKDRQAVTSQWFSVELSALTDVQWSQFEMENTQILRAVQSTRKLKRGTHKANAFMIRLADVVGDKIALEQRLAKVAADGVPNYFGPQRFGRDQHNLAIAESIFAGKKVKNRNAKSMALSAARSWVFNHYLSARMKIAGQLEPLTGDVMQLMGSHSVFTAEVHDLETLNERIKARDIRITGPLIGKGPRAVAEEAEALEQSLTAAFDNWLQGLKRLGVEHAHRPLWLFAEKMQWQWHENDLELSFELEPGAYATSVLREIVSIDETKDTD